MSKSRKVIKIRPPRRIDWRELHVNYVHIRYTSPEGNRELTTAFGKIPLWGGVAGGELATVLYDSVCPA